MEDLLVRNFQDMVTKSNHNRAVAIQQITTHIPLKVSQDQILALMREITFAEVEEVVKNIPKHKAPGANDFTTEFYQATWSFMGKDIWELVEESRRTRNVYPALNSMLITLILKQTKADTPAGFHPIALCNVIYKILSKIMVNRLKPILHDIISSKQTGFVKCRQILDGIITVQEAMHSLKEKKVKGMLIKLDLSKAYDRLSWSYLREILVAFGFDSRWIQWLFSCISTPNYSILPNGAPIQPF